MSGKIIVCEGYWLKDKEEFTDYYALLGGKHEELPDYCFYHFEDEADIEASHVDFKITYWEHDNVVEEVYHVG